MSATVAGRRRLPRYLHPTEQTWALGDREILCIATYEVPLRGALGSR